MYLLQQLKSSGSVEIGKSARKFKVTERSIRKDLLFLEEKGWIKTAGTTSNRVYQLTTMAERELKDQ